MPRLLWFDSSQGAPMTLLSIYVFCLIVGGAFVALSVFAGIGDADADFDTDFDADADFDADFDADADADFDADADADADHDHEIEVSNRRKFTPWLSFKFWTFALAFFGLTGVIFEGLGLIDSSMAVLGLSAGLGLISGLGVAWAMHKVGYSEVTRGITENHYLGQTARVVLPIRGTRRGKVQMQIQGKTIEMLAETVDDDVIFDLDQECFVLGVEDGVVQVTHPSALDKKSSN